MASQEDIINILEKRFDYVSARVHLKEALSETNIGEKKDYSTEELTTLTDALSKKACRMDNVIAGLQGLAGAKPKSQETAAHTKSQETAAHTEEAPKEEGEKETKKKKK